MKLLDRFPEGKHPWNDIYTADETKGIGAIIELQKADELSELRAALCIAAEHIATFTNNFGGVSAPTDQIDWVRAASTRVHRLVEHLKAANDFLPEQVGQEAYDLRDVIALMSALERFEKYLSSLNLKTLQKRGKTMHADYLEFVVRRLSEVFQQFRSADEITRVFDGEGISGIFPDFIRAAARPYLMAHHPKYRLNPKRYEKLDRPIQAVVQLMRRRRQNSHARRGERRFLELNFATSTHGRAHRPDSYSLLHSGNHPCRSTCSHISRRSAYWT